MHRSPPSSYGWAHPVVLGSDKQTEVSGCVLSEITEMQESFDILFLLFGLFLSLLSEKREPDYSGGLMMTPQKGKTIAGLHHPEVLIY